MPTEPRTPNIPPKSGTADPEKSEPPPVGDPPPLNEAAVPYQAGNQTIPGWARPAWVSSMLRRRTSSAELSSPRATAQTRAWSGVSSQGSFASSTTWVIERAWAIVRSRVRR